MSDPNSPQAIRPEHALPRADPDLGAYADLVAELGAQQVMVVGSDEATRLPVTDDVDLIALTGNGSRSLHDDEWGAALRRVAAVLGAGGHLIIDVPIEQPRADGAKSKALAATSVHDPDQLEQSLHDAWLEFVEVRQVSTRPGWARVVARKPEDVRDNLDRGWRDLARIDADLAAGVISEDQWHERIMHLIEPAYLTAQTPQAQSGKGGGPELWEYARRLVCDAINRDGTFLDIGCANGLLMADVQRWAAADGHTIEPYGVEISANLADLARSRYPHWRERIHTANARRWVGLERYTFVRTGLEYVPERSRQAYLNHLTEHVVAPGGRLIIGVQNLPETDPLPELADWGFTIAGISRRPHQRPELFYTALWIDLN